MIKRILLCFILLTACNNTSKQAEKNLYCLEYCLDKYKGEEIRGITAYCYENCNLMDNPPKK